MSLICIMSYCLGKWPERVRIENEPEDGWRSSGFLAIEAGHDPSHGRQKEEGHGRNCRRRGPRCT